MSNINRPRWVESKSKRKFHFFVQNVRNKISGIFWGNIIREEENRTYNWKFDKDWNFIEWKLYFCGGYVEDWKYDNINWHCILREWKKKYANWHTESWKFDKFWRLIEWERRLSNWIIQRWHFDVNTSEVYDWEIIHTDWEKVIINKNQK